MAPSKSGFPANINISSITLVEVGLCSHIAKQELMAQYNHAIIKKFHFHF